MKFDDEIGPDSGSGEFGSGADLPDVALSMASVRYASGLAAEVLGALEPRLVPLTEAIALMDAFAELERLGSSGRMLLAARAAEAGEWRRSGYSTPEEWLAAKQKTSRGRAKADLDTSSKLDDLGATADAVRDGKLSAEQAGTIADAASVNPAAEQDLLDHAERDSLAGLREEAERRKAEREDRAEKERQIRRKRSCRSWTKEVRR